MSIANPMAATIKGIAQSGFKNLVVRLAWRDCSIIVGGNTLQ
jgi:hypothetical protein